MWVFHQKKQYYRSVLMVSSLLLVSSISHAKLADYLDQAQDKLFARFSVENQTTNIDLQPLREFSYQPVAQYQQQNVRLSGAISMYQAVDIALQRHPDISAALATIASQNAYIDRARAGFYPQVSGSIASADLGSGQRERQLLNINATQMVYDFGKVKTSVDVETYKTRLQQANLLITIDDMSHNIISQILNIKRYQAQAYIAAQQLAGMQKIAEIANLRAKAGISSQADPIQAQSYIEAAQANLLIQQTQLRLSQQKLNSLLGEDGSGVDWQIPEQWLKDADLLDDPEINRLPRMMAAQAEAELAKLQIHETKLSTYPTLQLKGNLSQAVNGQHPTTREENGHDSSLMFEATSNFYQGGATQAQMRALQYAETASKAKMNSIYLDVNEQVQLSRQEIQYQQKQMQILFARAKTTSKTKELYAEQYKLGTRTVVDLLNAEQAIHSAAQEIENTRYDMYAQIATYVQATGKSRSVYQLSQKNIQGIEITP